MQIQSGAALEAIDDAAPSPSEVMPVFRGAEAMVEALRALAPQIAAGADEAERSKRMTPGIFEKIADTGMLRALRPRELGGAELAAPEMIPALEVIARADASTAWSFMIASQAPIEYERFSENIRKTFFKGGREVLTRIAISPKPGVTKVPGGYRVNGRWPLSSGSYTPEWVMVCGIVSGDGGEPLVSPAGLPDVRLILVPAHDARFLDNWDSMGLRSTQSNDVVINDVFVPDDYSAPFIHQATDGPAIRRLPLFMTVGPIHLGVILGIARGMIDDLVDLAKVKRPFLNPAVTYSVDPVFQYRMGQLETRLAAARSFAIAESESAWSLAEKHKPIGVERRLRYRAMLAHVFSDCEAVGQEVYALGGSNVLYNTSGLQRRFRDLRCALQHIVGSHEIFTPYGAVLLGNSLPNEQML